MQSSITWETIPFALATCVFSAALIAVADPPRAPPAQAFAACTLKQAGEKCSVQLGDRELAGTCASGPEQKLFCRPEHPPACGPPPEAIAACSSKSVGTRSGAAPIGDVGRRPRTRLQSGSACLGEDWSAQFAGVCRSCFR
jgi:hypothetical protein